MPGRLSVHSLLQSFTSDSTLLIGMLYSVAPEQQDQFVDVFTNVLLRGDEVNLEGTSEVIAEMLVLELDNAAWLHRDFNLFMRGQTHVTEVVEALAKRTVTAPDGLLVSDLASLCHALCDHAGSTDDGATVGPGGTPATAAMSARNDSARPGHSPGAWTDEGTGTDAYNRFSTSELQGLATAEQQFLLELGGSFPATTTPGSVTSPFSPPALPGGAELAEVMQTSSFGDLPPLMSRPAKTNAATRSPSSSWAPSPTANAGLSQAPVGAANSARGLRNTSITSTLNGGGGGRSHGRSRLRAAGPLTRSQLMLRAGLDYFSETFLTGIVTNETGFPQPPSIVNGTGGSGDDGGSSYSTNAISAYVSAIFGFICDVMDLFADTVGTWPLALRRALWLLMEAVAPPPPIEESRRRAEAPAPAENGTSSLPSSLEGNPFSQSSEPATPAPGSGHSVQDYQPKHSAIATVVSLRILCPALLSMPSYVLPVEEDVFGPAYLTTRKRVTLIAKLLQKAASGQLYDPQRERAYAPFNSILPSLTRRWLTFFDSLTYCGFDKRSFWSQPAPPPPMSGIAAAADLDLVTRFLQLMDQTFVQYQHIALLLRPYTETLHLSQWLRLTQYLHRAKEGLINARELPVASPVVSQSATPVSVSPARSAGTASSFLSPAATADPSMVSVGDSEHASGRATTSSRRKSPLHFFAPSEATQRHGTAGGGSSSNVSTPGGTGAAVPSPAHSTGFLQVPQPSESLLSTPTTSTHKGLRGGPSSFSAVDLYATAEAAADAFDDVLRYIRTEMSLCEEVNITTAERADRAATSTVGAERLSTTAPTSTNGRSPTVKASPTVSPHASGLAFSNPPPLSRTHPLLRNYCSVVGMATDGAATIMVYGDLLYCYLTKFYAKERENLDYWQAQCPRFVAYRNRMLSKKKHGGAGGTGSTTGTSAAMGDTYRDGDAVAMLYFLIHLSVTQNIRSTKYYLIFIHDNGRSHFSLGIAWLQDVIALMPVAYQQRCQQIVLVKPKRGYLNGISSFYKSAVGVAGSPLLAAAGASGVMSSASSPVPVTFTGGTTASSGQALAVGSGAERKLPPPVLRVSQIQELPKALPFIATFLPLPIYEYQILMKERKRERATVPSTPLTSVGGVITPKYGTLVSPASPLSHAPAPALPRRKVGHIAVPFDQIDHEQRLLNSLPLSRRYLHERWARPLKCWRTLRSSGIWMLQISQSFFEVLCTATCRRSFSDARLYPMLGVDVTHFNHFAAYVVDAFATFTSKSLKYIGQEPKWLRESVLVTNGPVTASTSDLQVQIPSDVKLSSPDEERFHSTWLYLDQSKLKEKDRQLFEATFQRLIFISTEVDSVEEGRGWDQIVSTRWGLDIYHKFGTNLPHTAASAAQQGATKATVSSRFVPSLRQVPLRSLWRLVLYNVQQLCETMRTTTPEVCPFTKMAAAVARVRVNLAASSNSSGRAVPPRRYASPEPGVTPIHKSPRPAFPTTSSTCDDVVLSVAAQALVECLDAEINVVRLVVSIVSYVRNIHAVHAFSPAGPLNRGGGGAGGEGGVTSALMAAGSITSEELVEVLKRGVSELVFSRPAESLGEQRVVELLACHGKELMQRARLPSDDTCSWHPYSRLWYSS